MTLFVWHFSGVWCKWKISIINDIYNISLEEDDSERSFAPSDLEQLVQEARSSQVETQLFAVQSARKILSADRNPPIDALIRSGILPVLVECLQNYEK